MLKLISPETALLSPLKEEFESFLKENISHLGEKNTLREACEYALLNGGKRVRPLIVMLVARALGNDLDVLEAALSVEYFHTASLIADDLPCMDNDDFRRSKPALHKKYGEATALLASYALISAGYEKIFHAMQALSRENSPFSQNAHEACVKALDAATRCAGASGAVGGQYKDLFPEKRSIETSLDVMYKKTVTLFEIAFVFGWIFGGGNLEKSDCMCGVAHHFGMAFQVWDDLGDVKQDEEGSLNIAALLGREEAERRLNQELESFEKKMKKLGMLTPEFQQTVRLLTLR